MAYNILSLDGGGSREVMEAVILKDVMAALTLVKRGELAGDMVDFDTEEARKRMREKLDCVEAAIHPGDVFKMVAGTSTGALMAFGLIHGKEGGRMSLDEVIEMYEESTATIFPSKLRSVRAWWPELDGSHLQTVLSIAPPAESDEKGPKSQFAWLKWFPGQLTDGYPVHLGQEKANPEAIFLRISPQSMETKVFKMDSWDIGGMKESMRLESLSDPAYFSSTILAALLLAPALDLADPRGYSSLSWEVQQFYEQKARFPEAMKAIRARALFSEKQHGPKSEELRDDYADQADCYDDMGDYKQALEAGERSLGIGRNGPALTAMGLSYMRLGQYDEAIERHTEALEMATDTRDRAVNLHNIAICYKQKGNYSEALNKYQETLDIEKALPGDNRASLAITMNNMAICYRRQEEYTKALGMHEESLAMYRAHHGDTAQHQHIAVALNNIGLVHRNLGQYTQAEKRLQESLDMKRSIHSGPHDGTARSLQGLGNVYLKKGDLNNAQQKYEEALLMFRSIHCNTAHSDTAIALNGLGLTFAYSGDFDRAEKNIQQGLDIRKAVSSGKEDDIAVSVMSLGEMHLRKGNQETAGQMLNEALEKFTAAYKTEQHSDVAKTLKLVGEVHLAKDEVEEAQEKLERSKAIYEEIFPNGHPEADKCQEILSKSYKRIKTEL